MRLLILPFATTALAFVAPASAQDSAISSGTYKLDPKHGSISFTVTHMGLADHKRRLAGSGTKGRTVRFG